MNSFKLKFTNLLKSFFFKIDEWVFGKRLIVFVTLVMKLNQNKGSIFKTLLFSIKNLSHFYIPSLKLTKGNQIKKLFTKVDIKIPEKGFIFTLDEFKTLGHINPIIGNISMDYSKVINNSLNELYLEYGDEYGSYINNQKKLLESIEIMLNREIIALNKCNRKDKGKYINYLENIKDKKTETFEEALQRILFFNQLLWQTGHKLNGLGRLDKILGDLYSKDPMDKKEALSLIKNFLVTLHGDYWYKSNVLKGDTGQIIIIGGKEENGEYFCNDLTLLFIQAVKELNLPDPKLLLRVSENTPRFLIEETLESINTGVGSPLISNDDVIIPHLIDYGYEKEDAYNYAVSACWEPAPIGKGLELNNIDSFIFLNPLNDLLDKEDLNTFDDFDSLVNTYKKYLLMYTDNFIKNLNDLKWEEDPLISLFIEGCNENKKDVSKGGAIYNNYGVTSVSLSNTVNSLYNIKNLIFINKEFSLEELNQYRKSNFEDEHILNILKNQKTKYGNDNEDIIKLTNEITGTVNDFLKNKTNSLGGKFKFGLSAPSFITKSKNIGSSLDGRKNNEPFNVHISSDHNNYTELMRFASRLDYGGNRFNGNVVDFMVSPNFIKDNFSKFLDFLILSLKLGIFQMQMNVVSSDTLINAKNNPDSYSNLIVRVWGFSAYFNDLPLEYKDLLIERALKNENKF